ncbi:hypothetical protein M9Y10_020156 [Tritrichomonas musculus]|uniref:F5/8 type C domain-containing protein n=1 Tax=Tritrichomonas musculus TaxID=1915356 RepID=A0ABR2HFG9_9EUKA
MLYRVSLLFFYFLGLVCSKSSLHTLSQSYERLSFEMATGKYADSQYLSTHSIYSSHFKYESTGDRTGYNLAYAFQDDDNYWSSQYPDKDDFHSSITITFNEPTTIEAFLLRASVKTDKQDRRTYHGYPTKIKVYTANNDETLTLNTIFTGTPTFPLEIAQYVFKKPFECKILKLEFLDVTADEFFAGGEKAASIRYLNFIRYLDYSDQKYIAPNGDYTNSVYMNFHQIPNSQFNYSSSGDWNGHSISYAFDNNDKNFWIANTESDGTTGSNIIVNFHKTTLFEGFLMKGYEYSKKFHGFPLKVNLYASLNNEEFKLHAKFSGEPSGANELYQYIPLEKVLCDRIKIEFAQVTKDEKHSNSYSPIINNITLFQSFEHEGLTFQAADADYSNSDFISTHKVDNSDFTIYSDSGDQEGHLISETLDNAGDTYWISKAENTDEYHNAIFAEFRRPILLEEVFFNPVYESKNGRTFSGFPIRFKIYTALNSNDYALQGYYIGMPDTSVTIVKFVLPSTVNCTKVKLEFVEVTPFVFKSDGKKYAGASDILFIQKSDYEILNYHKNTGYSESRVIPTTKFTYGSTGHKDDHPIDNIFDYESSSDWVSSFENKDGKYASIFINFTQPAKLEEFILGATLIDHGLIEYFHGYPTRLNVYVANGDEQLKLKATFVGKPGQVDFFQFQFSQPVLCTRLQLEFVNVLQYITYENNKAVPCVKYLKLIGEVIDFSDMNWQEDFTTQYINSSLPLSGINDTNFVIYDLPNDNDYLFVVEKQFYFNNVSFSCPDALMSAIKNNQTKHLIVEKCKFNSCSVKSQIGHGGAILSLNCAIICHNSDFSNCSSKTNGGGGGIYISIREKVDEEIIIEKCSFDYCSASFGGAVCLFSNVETNRITINSCFFQRNSLLDSSRESSFVGGSCLYILAYNVVSKRCRFVNNFGSSSVKIDNNFDDAASQLENRIISKSNVLIKECEFKIDSSSLSSLSYIRGPKNAINIEVEKCTFTGELIDNAHHIFVESHFNKVEEPKLKIKSCMFSSDMKKAINLNFDDLSSSIVQFDTKMQVFNYNGETVENESNSKKMFILSVTLIFVAVFAAIAVIVVIEIKRRAVSDRKNEPLNQVDEADL